MTAAGEKPTKRIKPGIAAPLTKDERQYVEELIARCGGRPRFRAKKCWKNAQRFMIPDASKRLRYYEGFLDGSIPHAWVTISRKVVDLNEEAIARQLRRMGIASDTPPTSSGVAVDRRTLTRHLLSTGEHGPVTKALRYA